MLPALFSDLFVGLLKQSFTKGISKVWENKDLLTLYVKTIFGKYRNLNIRFSISYLYRIRIPDTNTYLLVENRKINNQFQPVGGVYKRYGDDKLFEAWQYQPDKSINGLGTDAKSANDLRFFVKGKHVISVVKWFEEGKEREVHATREFIEELIETQILDEQTFRKVNYKHVKRVSKHLIWSPHHHCYEVLIYDILELIPDENQRCALLQLEKNAMHKGYIIAECEEIEQLRIIRNNKQIARIGEHTKYIINQS